MKKLSTFLSIFFLILTISLAAQIQSNGTGGGDWNTGTTWVGGVVPASTDSVVIQGSDVVTLAATGSCTKLTMMAGSKLTISAGGPVPGTSWSLDPASTIEFNTVVPASWVNPTFGNLIFNVPNYSLSESITVMGDLTILNNTLRGIGTTSGTNEHTVYGNVNLTGSGSRISAVNQGSATTASCTWNIKGNITLSGNNSGNRLILYESAGPHSGSAVYNIDGNLSIGSSSQIQFKSSSSTSNDYPEGIINLKGNLVQDGNIGINSGSGTCPGLTINFIGTSAQEWSGGGAFSVSTFSVNLNINNSAGVTLSSPRTIPNRTVVNLLDGKLTTDATNLLTITSGSISGGSASSFVNGPLNFNVSDAGPVTSVYPIGKGTSFRPLELTITQDAATATDYIAELFNVAPSSRTLPGTLTKVSENRYFTITKGTGANVTAAIIKLSYDSDDGVTDPNNLRVAKDDGAGNWVDLGGVGTAANSGNITSTNNFTSFSDFVLANATSGLNPLPVELSSFAANVNGNSVELRWITQTETNTKSFEIQRSGGNNWVKISDVKANGTTSEVSHYSFVDKNLLPAAYNYRLKIIDEDGTFRFSKTIEAEVSAPAKLSLSQNYPNPFNPVTTLRYELPFDSKVNLSVYNMLGQKVMDIVNEFQTAGTYEKTIDASILSSGIYVYQLSANNVKLTKRMILLK